MPRYSVFTPTHKTDRLLEVYDSLLSQTEQDWEWIVVLNGGAQLAPMSDPRVKVYEYDSCYIGELKKYACQQAEGEWLVELDHDDILLPKCLELIGRSKADFVYGNDIRVGNDWESMHFMGHGWESRAFLYQGHQLREVVSPKFWPSNFSRIWYAPDHVRAWRRDFYNSIDGHNPNLRVGDDHDLICRTAIFGTVEHIDAPTYIYRVHGDNSWMKHDMEIDSVQWNNHDVYFEQLCWKWATDNELPMLDLGGALNSHEGYTTVDRHNADVNCDLDQRWPFEDNSVGVIRAHDILEHLDPIHAMNEAYRVLVPNGVMDILVPSTRGEGAWCDPTHKSFWNKRSFRYYTEQNMHKYLEPELVGKFQQIRCIDQDMWEDNIPYVKAELLAYKGGPRVHGEIYFDDILEGKEE